jgi:DNA-binding response OmpR family regulator
MPGQWPLSSGSSKDSPTILIVEDEALLRAVLSAYLQECGYKVLKAITADEAVLIIEKSGAAIDLVFTELRLPGALDGFGLVHWIRSNQPRLPIVLTSSDAEKISLARELCADTPFMTKPYDLRNVVVQIRATINASRTRLS